jgi:hypothetical protein
MKNEKEYDVITKKNKTALEYILEQNTIVGVLDCLQYFTKNKPGKEMVYLIRQQAYYDHRSDVNLFNIKHTCNMWLEDGEVWY